MIAYRIPYDETTNQGLEFDQCCAVGQRHHQHTLVDRATTERTALGLLIVLPRAGPTRPSGAPTSHASNAGTCR